MSGGGGMKGWQAVPIVIPSFLILSLATIWYFSFHQFKDRPRQQSFTSPMNSLPRSECSENPVAGPPNHDHLVHLVDIPPIPAMASHNERRQHGSPAPSGALRAQRSRGSLQSAQDSDRTCRGDEPALTDSVADSDGLSTPGSKCRESYVVDSGTPPPIPAAHLHSPVTDRDSLERPIPLTSMSTLLSGKIRKPALRLNLGSQATGSSSGWPCTASLGPANEIDSTMVAEQSATSTETPSPGALGLLDVSAQRAPRQKPGSLREPKKIFVAKNPNSIFPSIKCEPNPAAAQDPLSNDVTMEEHDQASITSGRSYVHSLTMSIRSFLLAHPSPSSPNITDNESPEQHRQEPGLSISGPSLYIFERCSSNWPLIESEVYRNASLIPNPLIDHPDLEKGFQRPKEWGEKTADLVEAEMISRQMRRIDQLKEERLGNLPVAQGGEKQKIARNHGDDHDGDDE